jgi:putative photosynthetic complex assembly protein 2
VPGVYLAFLSALAVWGWVELAFLTGVVAGPNRHPCPRGVPEWERFIRAWGTIAYHEMLLVGLLIGLGALAWGAPNGFGLWTFAVLFFARISAKLNLFFGVPKINVEFLPRRSRIWPATSASRGLNWVYPISVTALTFATACWLERLYAADPGRGGGLRAACRADRARAAGTLADGPAAAGRETLALDAARAQTRKE